MGSAATAALNDVVIEVRAGDVLQDEVPETDVIVANIELAAVEALLARCPARVAVTSGYVEDEAPGAPGWAPRARLELDGWAADVLEAL